MEYKIRAESAGKLNFCAVMWRRCSRRRSNAKVICFLNCFNSCFVCVLASVWMGPGRPESMCTTMTMNIYYYVRCSNMQRHTAHEWFNEFIFAYMIWCVLFLLCWSCCVCYSAVLFESIFEHTLHTSIETKCKQQRKKKTLSNLLNAKTAFRATQFFRIFFWRFIHFMIAQCVLNCRTNKHIWCRCCDWYIQSLVAI